MDEKEKELLPEDKANENINGETEAVTEEAVEEAAEVTEEVEEITGAIEEAAEVTAEAEQATEEIEEAAGQAVEEASEAAEAAEEKTELEQELEDIRDMFQQELDKEAAKAQGGEEGEELIQELSEIEEDQPEEEEVKGRLCECCEENEVGDEYGEDYPYCESCREFMKKYPMRKSGIFVTFLMIVVFIGTLVTSVLSIDEAFLSGLEGELTGRTMTEVAGYYEYVSAKNGGTVSMHAVTSLIDGFYELGYLNDAVNLIGEYYSETDLKMPWNSKYKKIVDENNLFQSTSEVLREVVAPATSGEADYDYDEIISELEALKEETDENGNKLYSAVFVDYYIYEMMRLEGKDTQEQLELLKKMDAENEDSEWVYLVPLCQTAAKAGDKELTEQTFNRLIAKNSENTDAYNALASYYRFLDTPDADKMIEICNEAKNNAFTGDLSYKHNLAIAYLLKGEGALAMEEMDEFMQSGNYSVSNCNLYALVALYNGNEDIYESMKSTLAYYGYEISELVEKYKEGEMEIADILKDKGGAI